MADVAKWGLRDPKTALNEGHGLRYPHFNAVRNEPRSRSLFKRRKKGDFERISVLCVEYL